MCGPSSWNLELELDGSRFQGTVTDPRPGAWMPLHKDSARRTTCTGNVDWIELFRWARWKYHNEVTEKDITAMVGALQCSRKGSCGALR